MLSSLENITPNKEKGLCYTCYSQLVDLYSSKGKELIISFIGEFTQEKVNEIAYKMESQLQERGEKKGVIKRVFSIIIEALQNVRLHGEKDEEGNQNSFVVICKTNNEYFITTGNLALNKNLNNIQERIERINALDEVRLKDLYMQILTDGKISDKGGAGLGFVTITMKSKNKLTYKFEPSNTKYSCFSLQSKVVCM